MKEIPTYVCHKHVQAFKIDLIELDEDVAKRENRETSHGAYLLGEGLHGPVVTVDIAFMRRCNPKVGGYYVRYDDGYESYSPAKAFEEGYTPLLALGDKARDRAQARMDQAKVLFESVYEDGVQAGLILSSWPEDDVKEVEGG